LGFADEAAIYRKLLTDAAKSGIVAKPVSARASALARAEARPAVSSSSNRPTVSPKRPSVSPKGAVARVRPAVSPKATAAKPMARIAGVTVKPLGIAAAYAHLESDDFGAADMSANAFMSHLMPPASNSSRQRAISNGAVRTRTDRLVGMNNAKPAAPRR